MTAMKGRFNLFQAAMLRWRTLHPYNAVHVAAVCQPFDPAKLEAAIAGQLCADGRLCRSRQLQIRG